MREFSKVGIPQLVRYSDPDVEHEARVLAQYNACMDAQALGYHAKAGQHWRAFVELVAQRSRALAK